MYNINNVEASQGEKMENLQNHCQTKLGRVRLIQEIRGRMSEGAKLPSICSDLRLPQFQVRELLQQADL